MEVNSLTEDTNLLDRLSHVVRIHIPSKDRNNRRIVNKVRMHLMDECFQLMSHIGGGAYSHEGIGIVVLGNGKKMKENVTIITCFFDSSDIVGKVIALANFCHKIIHMANQESVAAEIDSKLYLFKRFDLHLECWSRRSDLEW